MSDLNVRFLNKDDMNGGTYCRGSLQRPSLTNRNGLPVADVMGCDIRILGVFDNDRLIGGAFEHI